MSKASTAILIKSRAKYGKRLTSHDYDELLNCQTVADISMYLKNNTHYNVTLEKFREASVHRGNLEQLLKSKIYSDFAQLSKFERSIGEHLFEYLLLKSEIDQLLSYLRHYISNTTEKVLFQLPNFFVEHSKLDFNRMIEAKSFEDILNLLKGTDYYSLLKPFNAKSRDTVDFTTIESVLDRYLYQKAMRGINKYYSGAEREQLIDFFSTSAEIDNIRKIYRAKAYFNITESKLQSQLNNLSSKLTKNQFSALMNCETATDVMQTLKNTQYGKYINKHDFVFFDELATRMKYHYCRRMMRYSTNSSVVLISTVTVFETEVENITNIIEGKRYGVDNENIKKLLILERAVN